MMADLFRIEDGGFPPITMLAFSYLILNCQNDDSANTENLRQTENRFLPVELLPLPSSSLWTQNGYFTHSGTGG